MHTTGAPGQNKKPQTQLTRFEHKPSALESKKPFFIGHGKEGILKLKPGKLTT